MGTQFVSSPHTRRINLRASERQEALLKQAAQASDTSLTDFILSTAVAEAEHVLADRRWFVATPQEHEAFLALLDEPLDTTRLTSLLGQPSPFGQSVELDDE